VTKFGLIGAAAVLSTVLAGPAMAQHVTAHHPGHYARSADCMNTESGNFHCRVNDYAVRSAWRAGSGWDGRRDSACACGTRFSRERVYDGPDPLLPFGE
jgi:hypothetical protein